VQTRDGTRILKQWLPLALVLAVAGAVGAYVLSKHSTRLTYTANVTLEVRVGVGTIDQPSTASAGEAITLASTEAEIAQSKPIVSAAARRTGAIAHPRPAPGELNSVQQSVTCSQIGGTALFSCSTTAHDPKMAAIMANSIAAMFIQQQQQREQARYQAVLQRIATQEKEAKATGDTNRLSQLVTLDTNVRLSAAQRASVFDVVNPAAVGGPDPTLIQFNVALAFFLVLALVLAVAFISDYFDDSVHDQEEIQELAGASVLGSIPLVRSLPKHSLWPNSLVLMRTPRSAGAEAIRLIRSHIMFARADSSPGSMLVTSPLLGDGKSFVAGNLAYAFAETGTSVILVDLDLRRPSISSLVDNPASGLTNLVLDQTGNPEAYLVEGTIPGLRVMPSGPIPPNPAWLVSSERLAQIIRRLQELADVVIIDSPPILAAADAPVLAALCDVTVLVVRPDRLKRRALMHAMQALGAAGDRVVGVVINAVPPATQGYYGRGEYVADDRTPAASPVVLPVDRAAER
jgi:capsular exopolysaccharide synthesis family protein